MLRLLSIRMSWVAAVAALLAACSTVVDAPSSTSAAGAGASTGSGTASTGSGTASTGSAGEECGMNGPCAPGSHCLFADHACGTTSPGVCPTAYCAAPGSCSGIDGPPACGCDGKVYDSACLADAAGVGTSNLGTCGPAPQGRFACGDLFCQKASQLCVAKNGDGCAFPGYECRDLPPGCGGADCGCIKLPGECLDGLQCSASADGDLTVQCVEF